MNNLLRTLTDSNVKSFLPESDLRVLLTTVKESRNYDSKAVDPFYDALDDLLHDLRTVTVDNRDAEPFLKPVSKAEAPDYYDVIPNPMDLQTMAKKVKQKQYKSKKEFKDDLDLIWSNCFAYNAAENHPLRVCAKRLKAKAERLLQNITDRKERVDPIIPSDLGTRSTTSKPNGIATHPYIRPRSPVSPPKLAPSQPSSVTISLPVRTIRQDAPFSETPAIVRSAEGMANFMRMDYELEHSRDTPRTVARLRELVTRGESSIEPDGAEMTDYSPVDAEVGDKRKINGFLDQRPRKRARLQSGVPTVEDQESVDLWWLATQSNMWIGNGFPTLARASSLDQDGVVPRPPKTRLGVPQVVSSSKKKRKKKSPQEPSIRTNTMLSLMNNNIRTMNRVRRAHSKVAALTGHQSQTEEGGSGPMTVDPPEVPSGAEIDDVVDDRPWIPMASGLDIGAENADDCLHWMGSKVLEHAGFQGASKIALDVLAGVTSEYLLNVGRVMRFMCDKYSERMTAEEIILHTLFESGTTKVQDLERYIKDDVIRYGSRIVDLEKKLVSAYSEAAADEAMDDEALFAHEEDDEQDSAFVMGNFSNALGDDFLGLRELGIADEFGLSSLTIPKKLLKGKSKEEQKASAAAKPTEPPPPFPPPPPFVPLDASRVEDQIGLLKPYYQQRISAVSTTTGPVDASARPSVLPDDPPTLARTKMGPLGQVMKTSASAGAAKKKAKPKDVFPMNPPPDVKPVVLERSISGEVEAKKKKKGNASGSNPAGGKKKGKGMDVLPPVVVAGS